MAIHKSIDKICVAVIVIAVIITVIFMSGEKIGMVTVVDEDAETNEDKSYFTDNDKNGDWDESGATTIKMNGAASVISGGGAYDYDGNVVISGAGFFVISGELDNGSIIVDANESSKVFIKLKGAKVNCEDDACFRIDQADKVFLTLEEDTDNYFESGSQFSDEALKDNTRGAIFAHDDLAVNGKGTLVVKTGYGHGIDANDDLIIGGGNLEISAVKDGIHVKDSIRIMEATVAITAEDDGIVSENEDGYFYMESGSVNIESEDDAIHTMGDVTLAGGSLYIQSEDDAVHSEKNINITGADIDIPKCHEGFEAVRIDVAAGSISVYPDDDGFNANKDNAGGATYINISGGNISIINEDARDADGLDSNGSIYISGGDIFISLPGGGTNNAIDFASENDGICEINGGNIVACGGSEMAEKMSSSSSQCSIAYVLSSVTNDNVTLELADGKGDKIVSKEIPLGFDYVLISSPQLKENETYTLSVSDVSEVITTDSVSTYVGESSSENAGKMGEREEGMNPPDMGDGEEGRMNPPDMGDSEDEQDRIGPPDMEDREEGMNPLDMESAEDGQEVQEESEEYDTKKEVTDKEWLWLGVSFGVLIAGIGFARFYKRGR